MTNAEGYVRASTLAATRAAASISGAVKRVLTVWQHARTAQRERRALAKLDDRMLKDIGLTRSEAYRETQRDFFDLPKPRPSRKFRW